MRHEEHPPGTYNPVISSPAAHAKLAAAVEARLRHAGQVAPPRNGIEEANLDAAAGRDRSYTCARSKPHIPPTGDRRRSLFAFGVDLVKVVQG
jgi:hypothetical protein